MQICPRSKLILLPLAPTIAGTIADYLRFACGEFYVSLPQNCDRSHDLLAMDSCMSWLLEIPLRRVPTSQYQYVSPIAHRLAAKLQLTPLEICQQLQSQFHSLQIEQTVRSLELLYWYDDAGNLYFQITDRSILTWLHYLHDLPLDAIPIQSYRRDLLPPKKKISELRHRCLRSR